jgi:hypothetical protein
MTATSTNQHGGELKQDVADDLRFRVAWALDQADDVDFAGEAIDAIEGMVCRHFQLTSTQFDLVFTGLKREIEQILDRAINRDLVGDAIVRELSEDEENDE